MKCSLGISNFFEEISTLSHSIVFLYFFALIAEEGILISLLFFGTVHSNGYIFSPLLSASLLFKAICKAFFRQPFCLFAFLFLGDGLISAFCTVSRTSVHSSSGTVSIGSNPLNLFITSTVFDLDHPEWLVVYPIFFNLSLNFAIRNSWPESQITPGLVFADCIELLQPWLQKYI